jgi:hypothetical protein
MNPILPPQLLRPAIQGEVARRAAWSGYPSRVRAVGFRWACRPTVGYLSWSGTGCGSYNFPRIERRAFDGRIC